MNRIQKYTAQIAQATKTVFCRPSYLVLGAVLAVSAFFFSVWLPNTGLIMDVFQTSSAPLGAKLKVAMSLLGGIRTNFSFLSALYTIVIAILFGMNIAMIAYYLKRRRVSAQGKEFAAGFGGLASGLLGIGCAACGSFILTTSLSFLGASAALTLLPLQGGEFGLISVGLLALSLSLISRKINDPLICNPTKL